MRKLRQYVIVTVAALAVALAVGALGLLVGAWFGGNYHSSFEFNGVRGYEAYGQIGLVVGLLCGGACGGWGALIWLRRGGAEVS